MTSNISSKKWLVLFSVILLSLTASLVTANYFIDYYGLFRDAAGKKLMPYDNFRLAKYLYSYNYIPVNYDGVLIGGSTSMNLDTSKIVNRDVYNLSLDGANISEMKLVTDMVMSKGQLSLVVFTIHPYMIKDFGPKTPYMTPREYYGALGNVQLLKEYLHWAAARLDLYHHYYKVDEHGAFDYEYPISVVTEFQSNPGPFDEEPFDEVDERALDEYRQLIHAARSHGAKLVVLIMPIYSEAYLSHKDVYDKYFKLMSDSFLPHERIINFNLPLYSKYTDDISNFGDEAHLSRKGAEIFSLEFATQIDSLL
jgi:hypothetical protein